MTRCANLTRIAVESGLARSPSQNVPLVKLLMFTQFCFVPCGSVEASARVRTPLETHRYDQSRNLSAV
jgi:hypothetical protein